MSISEMFEKYEDEFLKFERVENKLSKRPDLHAFLLIASLSDCDRDIVFAASHDEIHLDADESVIALLTEDQIRDLCRCGVIYNNEYESLYMFV